MGQHLSVFTLIRTRNFDARSSNLSKVTAGQARAERAGATAVDLIRAPFGGAWDESDEPEEYSGHSPTDSDHDSLAHLSLEQHLHRDTERANQEGADRQERAANSKLIRVNIVSPQPSCTFELSDEASVLMLLQKVASQLGFDESAAASLQLEFSETTLPHELLLHEAGMCDESLCSVLGVEDLLTRKANAVNIVKAAQFGRLEMVRLVCQYAPQKVHEVNSVFCLVHTRMALVPM